MGPTPMLMALGAENGLGSLEDELLLFRCWHWKCGPRPVAAAAAVADRPTVENRIICGSGRMGGGGWANSNWGEGAAPVADMGGGWWAPEAYSDDVIIWLSGGVTCTAAPVVVGGHKRAWLLLWGNVLKLNCCCGILPPGGGGPPQLLLLAWLLVSLSLGTSCPWSP